MYFKSLELLGFKSFAERTRLDFEPGVTAIVGPNGCGKSNIADSIKWVLGEQSAKELRGGRMEDVIFNGTAVKEPVGYAEVSLTLSNQDRFIPIEYDEVTVTRRLYRSGESEYLLNKTPVRLKDITELFMGTGIGTSAYSVMEQGEIDQVLSSKPEERREVFEEASGITKYKTKKKEALRRLEETENNLVRINDIISEVKRQINSIERQAKKAEKYREKYELLKTGELKLSRIELETLKEKFSGFAVNMNELQVKESQMSSQMDAFAGRISELNNKKVQVDSTRIELKSGMVQTDSEISKAQDKITLDKERVAELSKRVQDLQGEMRKISESIVSQEKEATSLRARVDILEKEDAERIQQLSEKEHRFNEISKLMKTHETTMATSKANVLDIAARQAKFKNTIAKVSTMRSTHDARLKRLETERETILGEKSALDAKFDEANNEIESLGKDLQAIRQDRDNTSNIITEIHNRIQVIAEESKNLLATLATNKSKLEMLQEATKQYEGFSTGVKAILGKKDGRIEGVRDCLAHLVSVRKGFESALEVALGEYLQAIVVDNIEAIEKAISYLKEHACGKASFIHTGYFDSALKKDESPISVQDSRVLGKAVDFVTVGDTYKNLLAAILKNIFIVKDINDAYGVLSDNASLNAGTFITLSGEVARRGFVSGGSPAKEDAGIVNRHARIRELTQVVLEVEQRSNSLEGEKSHKEEEKKDLELKLESLTKAVNEKEMLFATNKNSIANLEENIKSISDEISLVNLEIGEVQSEMQTLKQEEESAAKALLDIEHEARVNEERMHQSERLIAEWTKEREQLLIEITEQKTELGTLESKKEGMANTLGILESSLRNARNNIDSRTSEIDSSLKKIEELKKEIKDLEYAMSGKASEHSKKGMELAGVESVLKNIMQDMESHEIGFKALEKEMNNTRSQAHAVELKKTEVSFAMDNLNQRIRDVYKTELEDIQLIEEWQSIDRETLKNSVEEMRGQLDNLGTVNLVAIEEYKELQDRFVFLTNQRDDLSKAKESLLQAIAKINKTTREMFLETFNAIQVEFRNFFKMLFGGGDGELILMDESNILECSIEIAARPPGKRLQNVSLLSGGEKSLTAIALIFAIFKVRPSPFCVLDEIDAALDEANVDRFVRSLEIFIHNSQFIVITHNKKTIDKADIMYGITMQESGISKVISVKFSDTKKQQEVVEQK